MDINWSAFDGVLGILFVVVAIWVALKLVKRLVFGVILVILIAVAFFGLHLRDFGIGG